MVFPCLQAVRDLQGRHIKCVFADQDPMPPDSQALEVIRAFVSGELPTADFEQRLYREAGIEALLSVEPAPPSCQTGITLFHHLIGLDYSNPGHLLEAQSALADLLECRGITVTPSPRPAEEHDLILSAQPRWLDADMSYLSGLLATAPAGSYKERKAWLRQQILELFRFRTRPPRWLQAPNWPLGRSGPMVFLGQLAVDEYFHDRAAVYVFHDPATGECTSIVQVA